MQLLAETCMKYCAKCTSVI